MARITVTKIKQERTNQDRSKIDPFFDFLLHFLIFLLQIFSIASQLSCETMFKISSRNIEKCRRKMKQGPILVLSYHDRTKIGPFFDFLLNFSIFWLEIFSIASQPSCKAMFKISSKSIEKWREKSKKEQILVLS